MIRVVRGPAPPEYQRRATAALKKLEEFFHLPPESRAQRRPPFNAGICASAKPYLAKLFHGKCGYCETTLSSPHNALVETFRPKSTYWWLAYEWENFVLSCTGCNMAKSDRFPLENGAPPAAKPEEVASERPFLLNPCSDELEGHLLFAEDGKVYSQSPRGQATIDILDLNRSFLVAQRRGYAERLMDYFPAIVALPREKISALLSRLPTGDEVPFAAMTRQVLSLAFQKAGLERAWLKASEGQLWKAPGPSESTPALVAEAKSAYETHQRDTERFSLPTDNRSEIDSRYFLKRRSVERMHIENFKALRSLDIRLASDADNTAAWLMLLGENATGKSSVLKALALTLMDQTRRSELGIRPDHVLARGQSGGRVQVWLSGSPDPMELTFRAGDAEFGGNSAEKVLLLGYGSTRLLPAHRSPESEAPRGLVRVASLFDPAARLVDAEAWLANLTPELFGPAVRVLRELLPLRRNDSLEVEDPPAVGERRGVFVRMFGSPVPLTELSDGYQSVLALAADVLSVLLPVWKDRVELAEGVVLIDEVDAHLHPTWRMRVVRALRDCFPQVQFITTSHDPLCLKGLRAGEVIVLRRNRNGRVIPLQDLPSPEGMSADQLLTSEHFGLGSTVEPEIEKIFRRYYALLARKNRTDAQEQRLRQLKDKLARLNHMGRTRREQLMLGVIDAFLAEEAPSDLAAQEERRNRMLNQLIEQWTGKPGSESPPSKESQ